MDDNPDWLKSGNAVAALEKVPETAGYIVAELRKMVAGEGILYARFTYAPWAIRAVLAAAADIIEHQARRKLH